MRFIRLGFAIAVALLIILSNQWIAAAQTPALVLTTTPATLKLAPSEQADALITLTNPLTTTLQGLVLTWFSNADVNVTIKPPTSNTLAPQATTAWAITIAKKVNSNATGTLHLRLDYTTTVANQSLANIITGAIEIQERAPEPIEKIAQARVETALETVQERRSGFVYLIVTNVANVPITVTQVLVNKPDFVTITPPEKTKPPFHLDPQEAATLEYKVEGAEQVQSGKHTLVFVTELAWQRGNQVLQGTLTTSYRFSVGVLGESEILTVIGVPSFLLLPGFLLIIAFRFFETRWYPKTANPLDLKSPEFWMLAVFLSGVAAFAYPYLTTWIKWLGPPRDYLAGYGLRDIMIVWSGSVIAGMLLWIMWYGGGSLRQRLIKWFVGRNMPNEKDNEIQTIQKLAANQMDLALDQVKIKIGGAEQSVFMLERERANRTKIWIAPAIIYRHVSDYFSPLYNEFITLLEQAINADKMAQIMREASETGELTFTWEKTGLIQHPTEIETSAIVERRGKRRILVAPE